MRLYLATLFVSILIELGACQYVSKGNRFYHNPYKSGVRYPLNPSTFHSSNNHRDGYTVYSSSGLNGHNHEEDDDEDNEIHPFRKDYRIPDYKPIAVKPIQPIKAIQVKPFKDIAVKPIKSFEVPTVRHNPIPKPHLFVEDYPEDEYQEPEKQDSISLLSDTDGSVKDDYQAKNNKEGGIDNYFNITYIRQRE